MKKTSFVPESFDVPSLLETNRFRLRMLSVGDVEKDYEAVIESRDLLHSMGSNWPREGFTIEENLADLERHQQEFLDRKAFAYAVWFEAVRDWMKSSWPFKVVIYPGRE